MEKNFLVLDQYRNRKDYNDFVGKLYHFPSKYFKLLSQPNIEFIYYEPQKHGEGVYYGYGKISNLPMEDKREKGYYFIEIDDYKPFAKEVPFLFYEEPREKAPFYNEQNHVRRIDSIAFDEICLDGGIILNFKADAHLIKVLGEQLIGSEKVGILELIKNSIDAQASKCRVRIEKVPNLTSLESIHYEFDEFEGPVIIIEDDGIGMTREVIENGWLRPASPMKTNIKEKLKIERQKAIESGNIGNYESLVQQLKKEYGGRIPLGEKGVGRFATHRLGRFLIITTKIKENDYEYVLKIDWDKFDDISDNYINLEDIGISLTRQNISRKYTKCNSGTRLIIYGGRNGYTWDSEKILDVNQAILKLNSPNPRPNKMTPNFSAIFECPQITDLPNIPIYKRFTPNFSFDAIVNEDGIIDEYELKFLPPKKIPMSEQVWTDKNYDLRITDKDNPNYWLNSKGTKRKPQCGAFYIQINSWYRTKDWIDSPDYKEFTAYLENYGGISIYRDCISILPAEHGTKYDWLGLAQRHIKQGHRISYYAMIGNIELDQENNFDLIDKTNREGLLENTAFKDLSKLIFVIIQNLIEIHYMGKRDEYNILTKDLIRDTKELVNVSEQNRELISNISNNYPIDTDPYAIFMNLWENVENRKSGLINLEKSIKNLKNSITAMDEVQDKLTDFAGFGIAVAVSLHELNKIASNFYNGINYLMQAKKIEKNQIIDLKTSVESFKSELKRLGPLRSVRNEQKSEFNISYAIEYANEVFSRKLKSENIEFNFDKAQDFKVYCRYATLCQVLGNLFDNSIYWIDKSNQQKGIIQIVGNSNNRTIIFGDSGVGVHDSIRPYLFKPGYSLKIPASGLGLYICKSYLLNMNADIYETRPRDRIKDLVGAQFTLDFDRTPVNKEEDK